MNNLGELLDASKLPAWQIGAECGIHPTLISLYRTGARTIHERHAAYLADYFGVTPAVILGDEEIPWPELRAAAQSSSSPSD